MQSLTDEQLMEIYQSNKDGQRSGAFDCLYNRHAKSMFNFFYFTLNNDYAKAQDFVQDLFVKLIEQNQKFDIKQSFKPWIYRIASNMCKNEYRNNVVIQKYSNHILVTTDPVTFDDETQDILRGCINKLTQEHRSLIILRFKMNLSIKEIAGIYKCPEGTIKSRLFYATKELSKLYKG